MPHLVYIEIDNTIQLVVKDWDGAKGSVVNGNWELIKSEFTHQYRSDDHEWKAYKTFEVMKVPSWLRNEDYNEIIEKMIERKNEKKSENIKMTKQYVVGFYIDEVEQDVLMVLKKRGPEVVLNKLNGIGGKVEDKESGSFAISREFEEETGKCVKPEDWIYRGVLKSQTDEWQVKFYIHYGKTFEVAHQNDVGEPLLWANMTKIVDGTANVVPNLLWLLPLCKDRDVYLFDVVDRN